MKYAGKFEFTRRAANCSFVIITKQDYNEQKYSIFRINGIRTAHIYDR